MIDFDEGNLPAGTVITAHFKGLSISTPEEFGVRIFDTNNPTGGDDDLGAGIGNALIISEDGDSSDPDDNAAGGTISIEFDELVTVTGIGLLDIDEPGGTIDFFDDDSNRIEVIKIPDFDDGNLQQLNPNVPDVARMDINLAGSAALTELNLFVPLNDSLAATDSFNLSGLTGEVVIEIDDFGIPHINAANFNDGVFAQGFVHAQDRLWQMEYQRRSAEGTLAEILGDEALEQDIFVRTLGIDEAAKVAYNHLSPETKQLLDAYTAGVNAYLDTNPSLPREFQTLGYEPEAWESTDVTAIAQLQIFSIGTTDGGELTRSRLLQQGISPKRIQELLPAYSEDDPTIISTEDIEQSSFSVADTTPELVTHSAEIEQDIQSQLELLFPDTESSNNWVVSGERTTTGTPFLANDPHLSLRTPSFWYQSEIESPDVGVVGGGLPGIPGIQIGHNRDIAWGQTSPLVDTEDYYILEETEDGSGYIYQDRVQPYEIREETIQIKDAEPVIIQVKESVYGPVISDLIGLEPPVALNAVGLEPANGTIEVFLGINRAEDWTEFKSSLETFANPIANFVYADTQGNIGYIAPGKYPIRQPGHTGEYPVPGTGEFDWQGFIPYEDVPQIYNPESGYIVTANNKLTPDNYPYQINGSFAEPYRAERIIELIESKDQLSLEDMQAIQLDQVSLLYRDFRPILEQLEPVSEQAQEWRERLLNWDGNTQPNSQEASVFEAWYVELTKLPAMEVGQEFWNEPRFLLQAIQQGDPTCDSEGTASGCFDDAALALDAALERFGNEIPAWGDIHQARFEPLSEVQPENNLQVPLGGDRYTVNVSPNGSEDFGTSKGVSYRQIIDLGHLENSLYINPPGQSGDPDSDNFEDQLSLWQQGEYLPMSVDNI